MRRGGRERTPIRTTVLDGVVDDEHRQEEGLRTRVVSEQVQFSTVAQSRLTTDSNGSKRSESGLFMIQPRITMNGMTNKAIWIDEPTATPI